MTNSSQSSWVSLHTHSQYSILDSTASVQELVKRAKIYGMSSLAITDLGNLYGTVDFYKTCKEAKICPIIGTEITMAPTDRREKRKIPGLAPGYPIVLLCKNNVGYQNLCKLSSIGFLEGFYYYPRIDKETLFQYREGLICLTGSRESRIASLIHAKNDAQFCTEIRWFQETFGEDLYFELQRHKMSDADLAIDGVESEEWLLQKIREEEAKQESLNRTLLQLSKEYHIPVVATNDIHYIERNDWLAHEILLNIQSGEPLEIWERDSRGVAKNRSPNPKREALFTHELYFKSPEQMAALFSDIPEAISATEHIANQCHVELDFKTKHFPVFVPPSLQNATYTKEQRLKAAEEFLHQLCVDGIDRRYGPDRLAEVQKIYPDRNPREMVVKRFEHEFTILTSKGMCDYMLIVYDFIHWAKNEGIPMGPGRGSAAGSIIAYLIGITDIEPLRFRLIFERFINPERLSYPDIDVDICMERRQEVIDYTIRQYGKERVAQIITFGTMKAKMAIRDVGRVLNVPLTKVNEIAKLVPEDPTMTLERAFQLEPELNRRIETDPEAKRLLDMARRCEGSIRNTSTHAAGLIISANPITDLIPVCTAKDSDMVVTQFAMKPVESVGMLKIDFLGLKTLTSIQKCVNAIASQGKERIDWCNIPLDDKPTFDLLQHGRTLGVFQMESGGMQDLSKQLHIDTFEEIIAVDALYRPGPMDMIPSFIQRKHGREAIEIDHPLLEPILAETYGVMVYQEQVMEIASRLAGYTLAEGDVLRRAMGKKDKEEMTRQRDKFIAGCQKNNVPGDKAIQIFEKTEKFASYGFNKSHATAYAYLSYVTAYLKANYPKEWLAALMTCDKDDLAKVAKFIRESHTMQIAILPPDINESDYEFTAVPGGIRFAFTGIKGVGTAVIDQIIEERKRGPFTGLYDTICRIDMSKVGKKQIELLIDAGCFDFTGWSRDAMRESVEAMVAEAVRDQRQAEKGVISLFSLIESPTAQFLTPPPILSPTPRMQQLQREKELLGFYLTGHPMDGVRSQLAALSCVPFKEFENMPDGTFVRAAFIVESIAVKISAKSQRKFAILSISDGIERFELPVWSDLYEEKGALLRENQLLYGILQIERQDLSLHLQARYLEDLTTMDEAKSRECTNIYDRLKMSKFSMKKSSGEPKKKKSKEENVIQKLLITVNANSLHLSHIMDMKTLFRSFPGQCPIELRFQKSPQEYRSIQINATWGVRSDRSFQEALSQLSQKIPIEWKWES